jgi:TetR/AcrR family transcriptional regulator, transcriptional repressor for nem operon
MMGKRTAHRLCCKPKEIVMARPKAYDQDAVIDAAMRVFWRKGYVGTSMADIYAATGLKPGNLYATFTDKETLFNRAFEAYVRLFRSSLPEGLTGRGAIHAWLDTQARLATEDAERKGCLIVNTVTEREAHSSRTHALATKRLDEITDFFRTELQAAFEAGEIAATHDPHRDAAALTGAVVAIMSLGRAGTPAATIIHVAEAAKAQIQ